MDDKEERRQPLTNDDVDRIADAVAKKTRQAFHIEEEIHYNAHKRLDKLLDAYDRAANAFIKIFLGLVIVGLIVIAGFSVKGWK